MLETMAAVAGSLTCLITFCSLAVRPVRERLFGAKEVREGQKCLLRSEIVRTYYRNLAENSLRQYEYENLTYCYKAYKQLGGNSFVDHIYEEMQDWTVIQ